MSAVQLHRIDAAENMARFYRLDVQPSLFGFSTVYEWGRIGRPGQVQIRLYETREAAEIAMQERLEKKKRRGYVKQ